MSIIKLNKTKTEIVNELADEIRKSTGLYANIHGTKINAIVESIGSSIAALYADAKNAYEDSFIWTASGEALDQMAAIWGIARLPSITAESYADSVKFYTSAPNFGAINNNNQIVIPAFTRVWAKKEDQDIIYIVTNRVILEPYEKEKFVNVRAIAPGSEYNVGIGEIRYHNFEGYARSNEGLLKVINVKPIISGQSKESDASLRYRIINAKLHKSTSNTTAIYMTVKSINGVSDAIITENIYGPGIIHIIVIPSTIFGESKIIPVAYALLKDMIPVGTKLIIEGPQYLFVDIQLTVNTKTQKTNSFINEVSIIIKNILENNINSIPLGGLLNINALASLLNNAHPDIISIGKTLKPFDKVTITRTIYKEHTITENVEQYYQALQYQKFILRNLTVK